MDANDILPCHHCGEICTPHFSTHFALWTVNKETNRNPRSSPHILLLFNLNTLSAKMNECWIFPVSYLLFDITPSLAFFNVEFFANLQHSWLSQSCDKIYFSIKNILSFKPGNVGNLIIFFSFKCPVCFLMSQSFQGLYFLKTVLLQTIYAFLLFDSKSSLHSKNSKSHVLNKKRWNSWLY